MGIAKDGKRKAIKEEHEANRYKKNKGKRESIHAGN